MTDLDVNEYRIVELISGRKFPVKRGFFIFTNPNNDADYKDLSRDIDDGLVVININAVALIRTPEAWEKKWLLSFRF